jgi:hypothetical protein
MAETGLVPEFVASRLGREPEELTDGDMCAALIREIERRDSVQRSRARTALDAMNEFHDDEIPPEHVIGRDAYEAIIRENIDADSLIHFVRLVLSDQGRAGATVRHAETRAMRDEVWRWCDAHMSQYRSMDAAAAAIAGKLVPVTFRTVRGWIGEWRNRQSARRP